MFINAHLSCNFAKKNKKIGWDTLSTSILNKLHPGNTIFKQQLGKMQAEKEKFLPIKPNKRLSKR
jgi:hypothetical protein